MSYPAGTRLRVRFNWPRGVSREDATRDLGTALARVAALGSGGATVNAYPYTTFAGTVSAELLIALRSAMTAAAVRTEAMRGPTGTIRAEVTVTATDASGRESGSAIIARDVVRDPVGSAAGLASSAASSAAAAISEGASAVGAFADGAVKRVVVPLAIVAGLVALVVYAPVIKATLR